MSGRDFLDTNVLIYAYDQRDTDKQARAQALLDEAFRDGSAVVSAQVLGEFFVKVTRKIPRPMSDDDALGVIRSIEVLPVVAVDLHLVRSAIEAHRQWGVSYWDGLILAAAARAGCTRVLSEDLNAGQTYGSVVVVNPFAGS
jgi:predicted nucleic acid-binding protein